MTTDLLSTIAAMRAAFARDTSELPAVWTPDRPSTGHCSVASVILRDLAGGTILTGRVHHPDGVTEHQWNLIDGVWVDATSDQFGAVREITRVTPWQPEPGHLVHVSRDLAGLVRARMADHPVRGAR